MVRIITVFLSLLIISFSAYAGRKSFDLVILHNNDSESQLINAGSALEDFGGVARFARVVQKLRFQAKRSRAGVLMLSSGDNYIPSPEFNASLALPQRKTYYDSKALDIVRYDALAIGNHEFDFGPDVLARFINGFKRSKAPFLSANLNFDNEPELKQLERRRRIKKHIIVKERGQKIGIIGLTTPILPFISSPRNVTVDPDIVGIVKAEVNELTHKGVNKIILISHLQSIREDSALASQVEGIDVMIAGGGDELLANPGDLLIPGDEGIVFAPYPFIVKDAAGEDVPLVTTPGEYRYVGRLKVKFNKKGEITNIDNISGPVRVAGGNNPDAVRPNFYVQLKVVNPVSAYVEQLGNNIIGISEVALEGRRPQIRVEETNEGNLVADALIWQANQLAGNFNLPPADIALQNGGGIRNSSLIPAGNISELTTFDILPFSNFVCIVPNIPPVQFKEIMENAVSRVEFVDGRFAHISGFTLVWDPAAAVGNRVVSIVLNDGTVIVDNGNIDPQAPAVNIATIDFLARGGDQYPYNGAPFTSVGVSYQQALANYIQNALGGTISASQYPEGGEDRIANGQPTIPIQSEQLTNLEKLSSTIPQEYALHQNYPNPFNPMTTISYDLPSESEVNISIYSITGQKVDEVYSGRQVAGVHQQLFDASRLSSGIYFYTIRAADFQQSRKMILTR
jgi:5'-nucleotidase